VLHTFTENDFRYCYDKWGTRNHCVTFEGYTSKETELISGEFNRHFNIQNTYFWEHLYVTWTGMFHDVEKHITNCNICQKNTFTGPYIKPSFLETDTQFHPWDKLYLDIVGPLQMTE